MTERRRHVAFCGGGSGGHVMPAVAIAESLSESDAADITFLTSRRTVDRDLLATLHCSDNTTVHHKCLPLTGRSRWRYAVMLPFAIIICWWSFRSRSPDVVIGMGGFASVPGVVAAWMLNIPVGLVELNCIPGRANRLLSRFAKITFCGWPMLDESVRQWKCEIRVSGVPLRDDFADAGPKVVSAEKHILVIGGSQGASGLNDVVQHAILTSDTVTRPWLVTHQTGHRDEDRLQQQYEHQANVRVVPFIENMAAALRDADLVVSRAGAVALAEIAATCTPAVLIPLPGSADQHQQANAEFFCQQADVPVINQNNSQAAEQLYSAIEDLLNNDGIRANMRQKLGVLANQKAVDEITHWIRTVT